MDMIREIVADLHTHTTASDGEYTPAGLVAEAHHLGLKALAVTDHDTLAGLDEARQAASQVGLQLVTGVEVTLRFRRPTFVGSLHLLMYFGDAVLDDLAFRQAAGDILGQGRGDGLVEARVAAINAEFGPHGRQPMLKRALSAQDVLAYGHNISRRHFAQALKEGLGIQDAGQVSAIIGNDSPAYVPSGIEMGLLPPLLKQFPVVLVLAHPAAGSFPGDSHYKEVLPPLETVEALMPEFLTLGIQGLEVYYPGHTPQHRQALLSWADHWGLRLVTGGSDCHDRSQRRLGIEGVTQAELDGLLEHIARA